MQLVPELIELVINSVVVKRDLKAYVLDIRMDHWKNCAALPTDHPLVVSWLRQQGGCLPGTGLNLKVMSILMSDPIGFIHLCAFLEANTLMLKAAK